MLLETENMLLLDLSSDYREDAEKENVMKILRYLAVILTIVSAALIVIFANPAVIQFKGFSVADFAQQLTPLVLIALLIERSLEVFITVWRGARAEDLQRALHDATALPDGSPTKAEDVHEASKALSHYRFRTQKIALPSALILGIFTSALGVRALGNLADFAKLPAHSAQTSLFNVADVLLTGALLGGGSDFLHRLITTFTDLMDATSQKAKRSNP